MRGIFRRISPQRAVLDFTDQWRQPTPHRWQILGVAFALTFALLYTFIPRNERAPPARPEVTYISTWAENRTEAEIIASNCANQRLKNELQARLEQRAELRKDLYRALGRATFIDVDEIEAEIEAERAEGAVVDEPTSAEMAMSLEEYCARAVG